MKTHSTTNGKTATTDMNGSNGNGVDAAHPLAGHARTTANQKTTQPSKKTRGWISWLWSPGTSTPIPAHLSLAALRIALTAFFLGTLAGLVLPQALNIISNLTHWVLRSPSSKLEIAERQSPFSYSQLHFYLLAWATFHLLEFVITARYNATRLFADSFLISNGITYHLAHLFGLTEFILEARFAPQGFKSFAWYTVLGMMMILIGQTIRSLAMVHCADNFSHEVATRKRDDHKLVTDGIYRISRHPSYAGFFYWALGTQIMLGNPLSVKAHRNGIKKPRTNKYPSLRGVNPKFLRNQRYAKHGTEKAVREFRAGARQTA
ncbi:ICMT-domain-containing protein [Meira miltonrushii]|uniref:Protein-S-isoprenylcysteine O-methyltransferase n=1 Tax=Meira miltonrushii TaxID=1280837 RepID=A0A316VCC6_9BASI|nr:ICMT-domain-containing protein [Meira miltonrushii]PWN33903.1 ICMT-domain-containing protein [Meira miltonrushii]